MPVPLKTITHKDGVKLAGRWLFRHHPIVVTELSNTGEEPDAIGWRAGHATLVEVKISLADFYSDRKKSFRQNPEHGIGTKRYFLTPRGLLNPERQELHGWGLLETDGRRIFKIKSSTIFNANHIHEKNILASCLRRIGQSAPIGVSIKAYYHTTGDRAGLLLDLADETEQQELSLMQTASE